MPGIKPKSGQGRPEDKGPRKPRPHGVCSPTDDADPPGGACSGVVFGVRLRPGRGMGAADPGSHRYSGSPIPGHRAGLHCPDLPGVRGEAGSPGTIETATE